MGPADASDADPTDADPTDADPADAGPAEQREGCAPGRTGARGEAAAAPGSPADDVTLVLERWRGSWPADDPDAAFKAEVAAYGLLDPLHTLRGMSSALGIPVGALARYVLARWATAGSEGLLHLGGATVERLWRTCCEAEAEGTDAARLRAYEELRQQLSWLRYPLEHPEVY